MIADWQYAGAERKKMRLRIGFVIVVALLAGCKIVQTSTSGGAIVSASGDHDCAEDSVCEIDIPNGEPFSDTFTAVALYGYAFAGWRGTESYLCAGIAPTCTVNIPGSITAYDATDRLPDDKHGLYPQCRGGRRGRRRADGHPAGRLKRRAQPRFTGADSGQTAFPSRRSVPFDYPCQLPGAMHTPFALTPCS